jgi:transcriptional regulator with XRE-family HTH domain
MNRCNSFICLNDTKSAPHGQEDSLAVIDKNDTARILRAMEKWYERARRLMKEQGVTQDDLTAVLKVTRGAVGHYLSGRHDPSIEQLCALAEKLNCSLDWLLLGKTEPPPTPRAHEPPPVYGAADQLSALVTLAHEQRDLLRIIADRLVTTAPPADPELMPTPGIYDRRQKERRVTITEYAAPVPKQEQKK